MTRKSSRTSGALGLHVGQDALVDLLDQKRHGRHAGGARVLHDADEDVRLHGRHRGDHARSPGAA